MQKKRKPFIVTEELYVDEFLGGEIDVVYQAKDEEFSYLGTQVQRQKAEKQGAFFTNIYRTVMGNHSKICRKKITGIPDILVTENNSDNVLHNLGASHLDNIFHLANSRNIDNIAEQLLTDKSNDLIVTTFHNIFQMVNPNRCSEVSPKDKIYNEIISRFITNTSNRYGIMLSYTSLVTEDVPMELKMLMQRQVSKMMKKKHRIQH